MSHKNAKIASLILSFQGQEFDAHYLGYFKCFNEQRFFEAHEVLEELWLAQRGQARDLFYKGLIQLAGAFVHIQKKRQHPAIALFKLARANLGNYPTVYQGLDIGEVQKLIDDWVAGMETSSPLWANPVLNRWPKLVPPIVGTTGSEPS